MKLFIKDTENHFFVIVFVNSSLWFIHFGELGTLGVVFIIFRDEATRYKRTEACWLTSLTFLISFSQRLSKVKVICYYSLIGPKQTLKQIRCAVPAWWPHVSVCVCVSVFNYVQIWYWVGQRTSVHLPPKQRPTCSHQGCRWEAAGTCSVAGWARSSSPSCPLQVTWAGREFLVPQQSTRSWFEALPPGLEGTLHPGTPAGSPPWSVRCTSPSTAWTWSPLQRKSNTDSR